ncbi:MAG: F0F1 ATP synthase subunit delta [Chloroflexi bacterium]|nr:MAG: F0F1 ATP synthase subunit delta [Chloroflexota bacterium]
MAGARARRYARAVFELATEEGDVDGWVERLATLRDVLTTPDARMVLANPAIAARRRQEAAAALVEDRVGPRGANLARLLVGAGRLDQIEGVIEEYERLADEAAGRVQATAVTAVPLEERDAERLRTELTRRMGRDVRLATSVDPAIVGGLVLRVGDHVIDSSVATRLRQLRRQLAGVEN